MPKTGICLHIAIRQQLRGTVDSPKKDGRQSNIWGHSLSKQNPAFVVCLPMRRLYAMQAKCFLARIMQFISNLLRQLVITR